MGRSSARSAGAIRLRSRPGAGAGPAGGALGHALPRRRRVVVRLRLPGRPLRPRRRRRHRAEPVSHAPLAGRGPRRGGRRCPRSRRGRRSPRGKARLPPALPAGAPGRGARAAAHGGAPPTAARSCSASRWRAPPPAGSPACTLAPTHEDVTARSHRRRQPGAARLVCPADRVADTFAATWPRPDVRLDWRGRPDLGRGAGAARGGPRSGFSTAWS